MTPFSSTVTCTVSTLAPTSVEGRAGRRSRKETEMDLVTAFEKWWANTDEEWFKKMEFTTTKSITAAAFGAGYAAGESQDNRVMKPAAKSAN